MSDRTLGTTNFTQPSASSQSYRAIPRASVCATAATYPVARVHSSASSGFPALPSANWPCRARSPESPRAPVTINKLLAQVLDNKTPINSHVRHNQRLSHHHPQRLSRTQGAVLGALFAHAQVHRPDPPSGRLHRRGSRRQGCQRPQGHRNFTQVRGRSACPHRHTAPVHPRTPPLLQLQQDTARTGRSWRWHTDHEQGRYERSQTRVARKLAARCFARSGK